MLSGGRKCATSVTMVKQPNTHTSDVPYGFEKNGTLMSNDVKNNVISDVRKGKKSKKDVVGVQFIHVASTKRVSSAVPSHGSSGTTVKKTNTHTTDVHYG